MQKADPKTPAKDRHVKTKLFQAHEDTWKKLVYMVKPNSSNVPILQEQWDS